MDIIPVSYTHLSDELDAVVSELGSSGLYDLLYPQGLFSLATACNWGLPIDSKTMNPVSTEKLLQSYWYLPLSIADDSTFKDNRFFNDWLLHESDDSYWKSMAYPVSYTHLIRVSEGRIIQKIRAVFVRLYYI